MQRDLLGVLSGVPLQPADFLLLEQPTWVREQRSCALQKQAQWRAELGRWNPSATFNELKRSCLSQHKVISIGGVLIQLAKTVPYNERKKSHLLLDISV